jgi:hypothetical protein
MRSELFSELHRIAELASRARAGCAGGSSVRYPEPPSLRGSPGSRNVPRSWVIWGRLGPVKKSWRVLTMPTTSTATSFRSHGRACPRSKDPRPPGCP